MTANKTGKTTNPNTPSPNDTTSHKRILLGYMAKGGTLDRFKAVELCKCFDLSQRMGDLIREGVPVIKEWASNPKTGKRFKRYSLPTSYINAHTGA